ncbi:MAG TPA: alkaline phosphatase family protein [Bacteroidales bacterium]|nr:alkaline phosphatase family protein [Bacteroidales bacterium]
MSGLTIFTHRAKGLFLAGIFAFVCLQYSMPQGAYIPPDRPKLIVGIVVEQMRYDQLERLRDKLGENGIRKLLNEGTYYKNAGYDYMLTQSAPGHATIATGTQPSLHGIISDSWYLQLKNELVYCTQDNSVNPVGGSYESGMHSPVNLISSTFSDELALATNNKSRIFAIGIKESSAILSGGHSARGVYWFDNTTGTWMTSTWYTDSLPAWVNDFNALKLSESYLNSPWTLLRDKSFYEDCLPDSNGFELGFKGKNFFPYDLKKMSSSGLINIKRDYSLIRETPFSNSFTTDLALRLIKEEGLGKDEVPDYLSINYSATDYIARRFGPSSVESADAILRLDDEIARLLKYLNDSVGKKNVLVYFTAAHGICEIPSILEKNHIAAGYFRQNQALQLLKSYLNAIYGQGDWVKGYFQKQVFLNRTLIEDAKIPLEEIQKKAARFLVQFSGVASAYPYSAFEASDFGDGLQKKIVSNFTPQRSGDIIITLNPGWVEKNDDVTDSNSPYEYDSHVPLVWYGWAVNRATVTRKVSITDIAPTLSSLCRVPNPNACTGEPLSELMR